MTLDVGERRVRITDPSQLWAGRRLYDLYQEAHTPWEWHEPIFDRGARAGMIVLQHALRRRRAVELPGRRSTCPCYKIASFEIVDLPLIRRVAGPASR